MHDGKRMSRKNAVNILMHIDYLPSLPCMVTEINGILESETSSVKDISNVVSHDQSVSAMVLKMANSSIYSGVRKYTSLQEAITRIGTRKTTTIVNSMAIMHSMSLSKEPGRNRLFWARSFNIGLLAMLMAGQDDDIRKDKESIFTIGLLHEIGRVAMVSVDFCYFGEDAMDKHGDVAITYDIENYGISHAEAAQVILKKWNFDAEMIDIITNIHSSNILNEKCERIRHVCRLAETYIDEDPALPAPFETALETLSAYVNDNL